MDFNAPRFCLPSVEPFWLRCFKKGFLFVSLSSQKLLPLTKYQGRATEEEKFCKDLLVDSASSVRLDGSGVC